MDKLLSFFPAFIIAATILVVMMTELVKRLDRKDRLKGYRVYVPVAFSGLAAFLLKVGHFYASEQFWFWWVVVFGFSVFFFEAILKKLKTFFE
jgi:hypothetical protein